MASEMVERVARAMAGGLGMPWTWEEISPENRLHWVYLASVAIAAMYEPTDEMAKAASGHVTIQSVWRAMASEALK